MTANNTRTKQSKENRKTHKMLNPNKLTKTKPKPHVCVRVCIIVYSCCAQNRTVMI